MQLYDNLQFIALIFKVVRFTVINSSMFEPSCTNNIMDYTPINFMITYIIIFLT